MGTPRRTMKTVAVLKDYFELVGRLARGKNKLEEKQMNFDRELYFKLLKKYGEKDPLSKNVSCVPPDEVRKIYKNLVARLEFPREYRLFLYKRHRGPFGWADFQTEEIHFNLSYHRTRAAVTETLLHELVHVGFNLNHGKEFCQKMKELAKKL